MKTLSCDSQNVIGIERLFGTIKAGAINNIIDIYSPYII